MIMLLLIVVGVAIFKLIYMEGIWEAYEILLSEGDYARDKIAGKKKREAITKVYWSLVLAIIIWSFSTNDWHITWLVWLIGGVLSNTLELFSLDDKK